ncbi:hypothetical protein AB4097_10040 [Microvirga sp. 2MCAF35]|uniref:DUF6894 family protein n=1 Tax=Microvirga sp. 2MCAF35 TaxID=3232987 RepID=UPI003F99A30B
MPRFFFHVRSIRQELSRDELGLDFPDVETVVLMTLYAARSMQTAFAVRGRDPQDYIIEVVNAADELVFEVPFSAIFVHEIAGPPLLAS